MAPFTLSGESLREIAFPLGGIGSGCISLEGRGVLRDWEIYGRPNKNTVAGNTFAVLWCCPKGGLPDVRAVQSPRLKDFLGLSGGFGTGNLHQGEGLPCFESAIVTAKFPSMKIEFGKEGHPLQVSLEAFSPFFPEDDRSASMPVAILVYTLKNTSNVPVEACLAWAVNNPVGGSEPNSDSNLDRAWAEFRNEKGLRGLHYGNHKYDEGSVHHGTFALTTDWPDVTYCPRWDEGGWFDALQFFWNQFAVDGSMKEDAKNDPGRRMPASLGLKATIPPGGEVQLPFCLSWVFPNAERYWDNKSEPAAGIWTKYYATQWPDAWAAAAEFFARRQELTDKTTAFEDQVFNSDLPEEVRASVGYTASILRTPTVERLTDGTIWAWEGCNENAGCCHGSCFHVWNYALTHAYLFPSLYKTMLMSSLRHGFNCGPEGAKGALNFRLMIPLASASQLWHAAIDGQLGLVVQFYRTWRQTGDQAMFDEGWPLAKRALEFSWVQWDRDQDGLVDGDMHNTYDINFQGPNPLGQFFYLAALRAGEEMALAAGSEGDAKRYRDLFEKGSALTIERLWNGEFFVQRLAGLEPIPKYQHGIGCLSDQVFGALHARLADLGDLVDPQYIQSALDAIYKHCFLNPIGDHVNLQRSYVAPDESGLILCAWPNGGRPEVPFVYSDEVWSGIEYQVATHLAFEGRKEEALNIVRAIRKRHDGTRRNPYNEVECGSHYARALAAYGLVLAWHE